MRNLGARRGQRAVLYEAVSHNALDVTKTKETIKVAFYSESKAMVEQKLSVLALHIIEHAKDHRYQATF